MEIDSWILYVEYASCGSEKQNEVAKDGNRKQTQKCTK